LEEVATYSLGDAARILKVSPQRLRYWERIALVRLRSGLEADSEFEFKDLVCAKAVLGLIERGISLRRIRGSVEALRERVPELDDPLGSLRVWAEGSARMVVDCEGVLFEPDGQLVLDFRPQQTSGESVSEIGSARDGSESELPSAMDWFERGCEIDSDAATYDQAAAAYRSAIELDPHFADAHCNLGAVLYNQGQRTASRRCFERCIEIDARHVEAHFNLANLLEEDEADDLALSHYQTALAADPMYADLHINLALLHEKMGKPARGAEHWRRYLQLEPQGPWAEVARHRLGSRGGKPDSAIEPRPPDRGVPPERHQ
jgi:tetratricopeptide (TPR) repeat protein